MALLAGLAPLSSCSLVSTGKPRPAGSRQHSAAHTNQHRLRHAMNTPCRLPRVVQREAFRRVGNPALDDSSSTEDSERGDTAHSDSAPALASLRFRAHVPPLWCARAKAEHPHGRLARDLISSETTELIWVGAHSGRRGQEEGKRTREEQIRTACVRCLGALPWAHRVGWLLRAVGTSADFLFPFSASWPASWMSSSACPWAAGWRVRTA
jgi:hypothetical protein